MVWTWLVVVQVEIRQLKGYNYMNCTPLLCIFGVYDFLGWLDELPGIDREVKSDLAGGSKYSIYT